jgi:hypothetical protein
MESSGGMKMIATIGPYFKAVAGGFVGAATYVLASGVDLANPVWYAGLIVFLGAGFGIVWRIPNRPE